MIFLYRGREADILYYGKEMYIMKIPKFTKTLGVAIAFALFEAIGAFSSELEKHIQENKIKDLETRLSKLENKE